MTKNSTNQLTSLHGAGLYRNGKWLVRGVDLTVERGEIVTIIGPNGSGKSTTAKLALGIEKPTAGKVERIEDMRIGYVPQKLTVDWTLPLSVSRLMNLTTRIESAEMAKILQKMGIEHLLMEKVQNLSGGEFQRVLLARAIARKPDLLVLDEPVQGLDYTSEIDLYDQISEIRSNMNCGILMISHNLHLVMAATDKVICLNGHVCCQGSPNVVAANPEFIKLFGQMNESLAIYTHDHDHTHSSDGQIQLEQKPNLIPQNTDKKTQTASELNVSKDKREHSNLGK